MADIINLRRARKAKAKAQKEAAAAQNRIDHGISRSDRETGEAARALASQQLEGHRLNPHAAAPRKSDEEPSRQTVDRDRGP